MAIVETWNGLESTYNASEHRHDHLEVHHGIFGKQLSPEPRSNF